MPAGPTGMAMIRPTKMPLKKMISSMPPASLPRWRP
jgi:hypothetical protein